MRFVTVAISLVVLTAACGELRQTSSTPDPAEPSGSPSPDLWTPGVPNPPATHTIAPPRLNGPDDFDDYPQAVADYLTANPDEASGLACLYKLYEAWGMPYFSGERSCRAGNTDEDPDDEVVVVLIERPAAQCEMVLYRVAVLDPTPAGYSAVFTSPPTGLSCHAINMLGNVILAMEDVNADGGGELAYAGQWCGAHTCGVDAHIVSGTTAGYRALTPMEGFTIETPRGVELSDTDGDGSQELILSGGAIQSAASGPGRLRTDTYAWDGVQYVLRTSTPD